MTSLHELKVMVDALVDQVHGSPVADQPILFNGQPVDITLRAEKNSDHNKILLDVYAD